MRTKTLLKYIVTILVFTVSYFSISAQDSIKVEIAIPISLEYPNPLYSMFFTSSTSFYATIDDNGQEFIKEFEFKDGLIEDNGFVIPDSGVAIAGQINGLPYLYLQHKGDVVPGYPDDSPFSFTSYSEEVFVAGYLENQLVIVNQNGKLNLCKAIGTGNRVKYQKISISDPKKDENGIFILADSLYFSRIDKAGFYKLHQSVYDHEESEWGEPILMPDPYNIEGSNTLFAVWYEGIWYITSDRDGILTIYAIGDKTVKNPIWELLVNNTKTDDTLSAEEEYNHKLRMKIRDKTYEEYVSSNNYGFYNIMLSLTDSMHVVQDGDTIYILEVPKKDLRECNLHIVGRLKSKDDRQDLFMAENDKGEKFTLIPIDFAIKNGLEVDDNLVKKKHLSKKDFILLDGVEYAAYGHSVFDPNEHDVNLFASSSSNNSDNSFTSQMRTTEELKTIEDIENAIRNKSEFTEEELIKLFGDTLCNVHVGYYTRTKPNKTFWSVFNGNFPVTISDRIINGRKTGDQYTIKTIFSKSFSILSFCINSFEDVGINEIPFTKIRKWNEKYTIFKINDNNKYYIE